MKTLIRPSSSEVFCSAREFSELDAREQFAVSLHHLTENAIANGVSAEDAAYFLLSAAREALDRKEEFSSDSLLAREYIQAAVESV